MYRPQNPLIRYERLKNTGTKSEGAKARRYIWLQDTTSQHSLGVLVGLGTSPAARQCVFWRVKLGHEMTPGLSDNWEYAEIPLNRPDLNDIRDLELTLSWMLQSQLPWVQPTTEKGYELALRKQKLMRRFLRLQEKCYTIMQQNKETPWSEL